jgi:mRNA interferase MazF
MMLYRYDIVLVSFPFTDGPAAKPRPALVVATSERYVDALLAFISSRVSGAPGRDELDIPADHPDFAATGLKVTSRLRLSRRRPCPPPLCGAGSPPCPVPWMLQGTGTQFPSCSPGTRANSSVLLVTSVARWLRAWAAIKVSSEPIGVPRRSSSVRNSP